ncbi:MAG: glycosyltransferase family 4 protein [Prevotellaceae bacterium]|jgi:glycosyltransferase involved in cell wall biosynthesis|nr:glycosyltransferase family 4 protein [Prevotellaceae bacterium]
MKILFLSTSEQNGGAAIAASRLMQALNKSGHDAKMLVRDKQTNNPNVISIDTSWLKTKINLLRFAWERGVIFVNNRFSKKNLFAISIANTGTDISRHSLVKWADIIHLHWINQGFLSLKNIEKLIQTGKPIVWTMHDMWACTGICHHAYECEHFKKNCGICPFLHTPKANDLSHKIFQKKAFVKKSDIRFVAVSNWLKRMAESSGITKNSVIQVVPNVIDTDIFKPENKIATRASLAWEADKKIILMGAAALNNSIKGFGYLCKALSILTKKSNANDYLLVLFGSIKNNPDFLANLPVPHCHVGSISDPRQLAKLYQAADVTVVSSLYETFGQTISEAMACACPAVSFNNSGQTDIIDHKQNGYLATYKSADDLAKGIEFCLENMERLSRAAREKVLGQYSEKVVAKRYLELYSQLIK